MAAGAVQTNITSPNAKAGALFNGTTNRIVVTDNSNLNSPLFTITAWIKRDSDTIRSHILRKGSPIIFQIDATNHLSLDTTTLTDNAIISTATISDKLWHFVSCQYDGSRISLRIDSTTKNEASTGTRGLDATNLAIGDGAVVGGTFHPFAGVISDMRFYNVGLNDNELNKIQSGENITKGLVSRWKFEKDYNDSVDSNNGTNTGTILGIFDTDIAAAVAADRTTANDIYLIAESGNGKQAISVIIEET